MASSWQITCINKTNRYDPHERIRAVGGLEQGGWTLTVDQVIGHIRQGNGFWVNVSGVRDEVEIAVNNGREYIKTRGDGVHPKQSAVSARVSLIGVSDALTIITKGDANPVGSIAHANACWAAYNLA